MAQYGSRVFFRGIKVCFLIWAMLVINCRLLYLMPLYVAREAEQENE